MRADIVAPDNLVALGGLLGVTRRTAYSWRAGALTNGLLVVANGRLVPGPAWATWWTGRAWDPLPATLVRDRGLSVPVKAAAAVIVGEAQRGRRGIPADAELAERAGVVRNTIAKARRELAHRDLGDIEHVRRGRLRLATFHPRPPLPWTLFPGRAAGADRAARSARGRLRGVQRVSAGGVQFVSTSHETPFGYYPDHRPAPPTGMVPGSFPQSSDGLQVPSYVEDHALADLSSLVEDLTRGATGRPTRAQLESQNAGSRETAADQTRRFLADRPRVFRVIQRGACNPTTVVEELLGLAGFFDRRGDLRRKWAVRVAQHHGGAAVPRLIVVLGDLARDRKVQSIGATLRRRISDLCSNRPETAISANGPQSVADVLDLFTRPADTGRAAC